MAAAFAERAYRGLEHGFDAAFGAALNPWRHLGALGFLFFWVIAASGLYLYAMFDTAVDGAYQSVESLTREQWYFGGLLRSMHRYAADGLVLVTLLHVAREFVLGRYFGFRRFSWLTGVPLLWLVFVAGVVGFWLKWDRMAQFSVEASAEWFDSLPFFATPLTRNFLNAGAVSDRLFSLFVFVHIGVPLLMTFGLWFHIQRISRAEVMPPRALTLGTLAMLLAMALVRPVVSLAPADLGRTVAAIDLDWFYLFAHPLMHAASATLLWALVLAATALLLLLPQLPRTARAPVAQVHPDHCNGCRRCFDDCPYAAITMVPHPNGKAGFELAKVDPDLCASCGICAGSCPSSTPFRSADELVTGIDMPQMSIDALRRQLSQSLARMTGERPLLVIGCDQGAPVAPLERGGDACVSLICTGMLAPSFIDYGLRHGAAGVLVTGCRECGCAYRLGNRWTEQRLNGTREPRLRQQAKRERVRVAWADRGDETALAVALAQFRRDLPAQGAGKQELTRMKPHE